ncbi:hypothetical protein BD779DRAFT_1667673 [Infundibulicybe gibba]|nr:hypothetical protein BD779DRAFT_1667673 [Infundibulicybe gibba]
MPLQRPSTPLLQFSRSASSLAPSIPSTSEAHGSSRHDAPFQSATDRKRVAHRSLNLLGKIPKDFSSLIRSHSTSRREVSRPDHQGNVQQDLNMSSSRADDERPSRKSKSENRLYNFLTRSRSRSQSKNGRSTSVDKSPIPDLPIGHSRHASPGSSSKPASRIQSRPLSSTTTATNTTITPQTPRAKKRTPVVAPVPSQENDGSLSRSSTPKGLSATRKKLHNLFGIPLSSPRKSSFSSRGSSPGFTPNGHLEVIPPLPSPETDDDPTPRPRRSFSPFRNRRTESPTPLPRPNLPADSTGSNTNVTSSSTSTSTSSRIDQFFRSQKIFAAGSRSPPEVTTISRPQTSPGVLPMPSSAPSAIVSHPIKRVLRTAIIIHTPATPLRSATTPNGHSPRKGSVDSAYPYRSSPMDILDEEGTGKGKEPEKHKSRAGLKSVKSSRTTKHGSFDFERPGWTGMMARSGSGGTVGTTVSGGSRSGDSVSVSMSLVRERDRERRQRESAIPGPGLAGVGTLQRELSVKRAKEEREKEKAMKRILAGAKKKDDETGHSVDTHRSGETGGSGTTGKVSSWSKGTSRRGGTKSGASRLAGLSAHHGPFPFEPPVPSPTISTGSNGAANAEVSFSDRDRQREKEREMAREKKQLSRGDRQPVPVPVPSVGHRSGTKGRSLDLGLGLAWAPTKVREDALLPSSTFFGRSMSISSSGTGRSGSLSSAISRGRKVKGIEEEGDGEENRMRFGKEVAELFRSALDDEGYDVFKRYVHRFDAHDIPFDGPTGILARVERLLAKSPKLRDEDRQHLLDNFVRIILQNA